MKEKSDLGKRFWEIDFLRGVAILMMITYHTLVFRSYFGENDFNLSSVFWRLFQITTASIFLFLVGVSLTLSYSRFKQKYGTERLFTKFFKRGLIIFSLGLCMTAFTWLFLRKNYVRFGILHLIGITIILAYPFLKAHFWSLMLGAACIIIGICAMTTSFDFSLLMWLVFMKSQYYHTVDYFPLMPWFGVTLVGLFIGNYLYPRYTRRINIGELSHFSLIKPFCLLGRHSLIIYFLHQPILVALLFIFGETRISFLNKILPQLN